MNSDTLTHYGGNNVEMVNLLYPLKDDIMKCLEIGPVMPLVKEELAIKIQSSRLSEGKGELNTAVLVTSFLKPHMYTTHTNLMTGSAHVTNMDEDLLASGDNLEMVTVEDPLQGAIIKSLEIGSVMPLVKEELKLKIQSRRLSEGMGELKIEFTSLPKYELTPEEKEKIEVRKKRNRQSASKSRQKRKGHEENIIKQLEEQQAMHDKLNIEVNTLRNIKKLLQARMIKHLATCPKYSSFLSQQSKMNPLDKEAFERLRKLRKRGALPTSNLHNVFPKTTDQWQIAISAAT